MKPSRSSRAKAVYLLIPLACWAGLTAEETGKPSESQKTPPPVNQAQQIDPFAETPFADPKPTINDTRRSVKLPTVLVRLEIWETQALELAKRLDTAADPESIEKLRADFLSGKVGGKLIASPSLSMDPLSASSSEAITERIYPTEYTPTESNGAKKVEDKIPAHLAFVFPTAFETRNTGETFEVSARQVTAEARTWDAAICFEAVGHAGDLSFGKPKDRIAMPLFTTFRVTGVHRVRESQWRIVSIQCPPTGTKGDKGSRWVCLLRLDPL